MAKGQVVLQLQGSAVMIPYWPGSRHMPAGKPCQNLGPYPSLPPSPPSPPLNQDPAVFLSYLAFIQLVAFQLFLLAEYNMAPSPTVAKPDYALILRDAVKRNLQKTDRGLAHLNRLSTAQPPLARARVC